MMPGFIAVAGTAAGVQGKDSVAKGTIIRSEEGEAYTQYTEPELFLASSSLKSCPGEMDRTYSDKRFWAALAGDVVTSPVPFWSEVIKAVEAQDFGHFRKMEGNFSILVYDREKHTIQVICDRRSQYPVYFGRLGGLIVVSTTLGAFVRLGFRKFNPAWLQEYLFFNFPLQTTTFLEGVDRGYLALARTISLTGGPDRDEFYAEIPRRQPELLDSRNADHKVLPVFSEVIKDYYSGTDRCASALTGGWDARTILALAPPELDVPAYTWGQRDCNDIKATKRNAHRFGVKHHTIEFGEDFLSGLPAHIVRTVYETHGTMRVNRAGAQYGYERLWKEFAFPLLLTGISFDMQFRGHAVIPSMVSPELGAMFSGRDWDESRWESLLGGRFGEFRSHVRECLDGLQEEWGPLQSSEFHLLYLVYSVSLGFFAGDVVGAGLSTTLRVPAWDSRLVDLSFSISESTLNFSQFGPHCRGALAEMSLQSRLLAAYAPRFAQVPVGTIHPGLLARSETMASAYQLILRAKKRLMRGSATVQGLVDWQDWLMTRNRPFVDQLLLDPRSLIYEYLDPHTITKVLEQKDVFTGSKLMTTEIILRLIENGWQIPEDLPSYSEDNS